MKGEFRIILNANAELNPHPGIFPSPKAFLIIPGAWIGLKNHANNHHLMEDHAQRELQKVLWYEGLNLVLFKLCGGRLNSALVFWGFF